MIKLNMLTGDLIFRQHKTGVHFVHEYLMNEAIKDGFFNLTVSFYRKQKEFLKKYKLINTEKVSFAFASPLMKILIYFIPVQWIFGKQDVYFCDGIFPAMIGKSKRICLIHDLMVYRYPENYSLIMKIYLRVYFHRAKKADRIITVSQTTKEDIVKYLKIDPNIIDVAYPGVKEAKNIAQINTEVPSKYIFYIGDSRKNKNLIGAVHGFADYINKTKEDMYFLIAGGGDKTELKAEIQKIGMTERVWLLGYISEQEKNYLYKHAYAFIFVSFFEGFGIPILEAMMRGVPVITSNTSSMREIAEGYAILVNPYDYESISNGILKLSDDNVRQDCIKLGHQCVKKYNWKHTYNVIKKSIRMTISIKE